MSKINVVTTIVSLVGGSFGWTYKVSKGRRQYQRSGVFTDINTKVEAEVRVFKIMCDFIHEKMNFEESTKITVISECREVIRLMRSGDVDEIGDLKNDPSVMEVVQDLLKHRETKAKCVYKYISKDKKKDGAKENCSARR